MASATTKKSMKELPVLVLHVPSTLEDEMICAPNSVANPHEPRVLGDMLKSPPMMAAWPPTFSRLARLSSDRPCPWCR
eukprot:12943441-Heterocapsa_arctica.AAC.1